MGISARNLLSAQDVGREEGRPDTSLFYICSGAHAAELNLLIEKIPIAQAISKSLVLVKHFLTRNWIKIRTRPFFPTSYVTILFKRWNRDLVECSVTCREVASICESEMFSSSASPSSLYRRATLLTGKDCFTMIDCMARAVS